MKTRLNRRKLLASLGFGVAGATSPWKPLPSLVGEARAAGRHRPRGYIRTNWSQDPFALGSYSIVVRGARQRDRRRLEEPVGGRLFFAGEAAHPDYNSTVHAAFESGERAAEAILAVPASRIRTVGVIGAGMAGLACASWLAEEGREAHVLEARDRIGGRVWTDNSLDLPLDLGASWIHGVTDNPMTGLATDLGLARHMTGDDYLMLDGFGEPMPDRDAPGWLENVVSIQHTFGLDRDQINMRAYWFQDDYDGGDATLPAGYASVFQGLEGDYALSLNSVVESISHGEDGVTVSVAGREPLMFDAVVVTLPLGVLKVGSVRFEPPLPEAKQEAIERLGMGLLDKLYLVFDEAFWDPQVPWIVTPDTGLAPGYFNQWFSLVPSTGAPVLCAFHGGPPAFDLANQSDEAVLDMALGVINRLS